MGLGIRGQDSSIAHINTKKWVLGGVQAGLWGGTFYSLNKTWYANYPRSDFHFYNDWKEWQQMDKAGHAWSSYQISNHTSKIWQWAGMEKKKAVMIGSISGMAYLSIIEILDGYSASRIFSPIQLEQVFMQHRNWAGMNKELPSNSPTHPTAMEH